MRRESTNKAIQESGEVVMVENFGEERKAVPGNSRTVEENPYQIETERP